MVDIIQEGRQKSQGPSRSQRFTEALGLFAQQEQKKKSSEAAIAKEQRGYLHEIGLQEMKGQQRIDEQIAKYEQKKRLLDE